MGSLDRIGQLQAAKAFLRFCKHNKSSASSTGPPGHEKANQSSSLIGVSDFDKLVAKTNLSRQFILKQVNESENQEQQIANSQIPFSSLAPVLKNDVYLEKRTQFTLPGHDQSSPKFKNVRIIELEGKWKYWIPTKHVKSSDEDIIVRYLNKNGINTPDVIPLPPNAPSSFNREEFLKKCKAVKFGNESLTFHETRKLPKEIKSNISGLTDSKDVRQKIEDHLTPLSAEDALNSKCSEHAEKVLDSDCILLFSDQPEDKKSPHIKFSPGKKCPPGRFSEVGNWISVEMNNLSVPGHQMDFSFYDSDVKFLYEKLEGEQRVLATNLKVYSTICSSWRAYLMSTKLEVVSKVLRLTPEHDKGKICVRWRVKTLSPLSVFAPLLGKREKNYSYLDYYSEFYVNENGFITCHVISKVAPTNSGAEISRSKRMAAGAMATLFGLSGSGSDQMTSPIPAVGFKSLPDSLNSSIVEKH